MEVVAVLALLGGVLWLLRRRGMAIPAAGGVRQMSVAERTPLGAQHALHLVRVKDKVILVATGPGCCQMRELE